MNESQQQQETHYGDSPHRPDIHGILIPGARGRLFSALYTAGGPGLHPTVLLLHGIPGCERNLDLAQSLRRVGFHVMTFHYSGCWGSDGAYSLANDLEDANTVLDFILRDTAYDFDKARIYAVGHSLGSFVCGQLTAARPEIQAGVLLMPCDIGRLPQIARENPAVYQSMKYVLEDAAQWLTGATRESLWQEIAAHSETFRLESVAGALAQKPLLCVAGTLDVHTPPDYHCQPLVQAIRQAGGTKLRSIRYPTDHFFADYRLTVAGTVADFLLEQCSAPQ